MKLSFRTRLALWVALFSGIVLLVFVAAAGWILFDNLSEEAEDELKQASMEVLERVKAGKFDPNQGPFSRRTTVSAAPAEMRLVLLRSVIDREDLYHDERWDGAREGEQYTDAGFLRTEKANARLWRTISREKGGWLIRMAVDLKEVQTEVGTMIRRMLRAMPVALILIGLGAWAVAGRASRPIVAITKTAESITPQGLNERIPDLGTDDEIGRLGRVLNRMMDRLELAFKQTRRFSSDASHELRTPLTIMQGKLEAALQRPKHSLEDQQTLADLLNQVQNLKTIIESLLMFSRSDAGELSVPRETVDVSALMRELVEDLELEAEENGISVTAEIAKGVTARGDGRLLRMAVSNLLHNAVKYNLQDGGSITCRLEDRGDSIAVSVENTGATIPPDRQAMIFDRFYRGDPSRSRSVPGFGLGLSLARVIAEAHGGGLRLVRSADGVTTFRLEIATGLQSAAKAEAISTADGK